MISVRLSYTEFVNIYHALMDYGAIDTTDHGRLLTEHWCVFLTKWHDRLMLHKVKYMLKLSSLEALAYKQLMLHTGMPAEYAVTVNKVLAAIDAAEKKAQVMARR